MSTEDSPSMDAQVDVVEYDAHGQLDELILYFVCNFVNCTNPALPTSMKLNYELLI